ncbi:MAG: replicative DNA helicase [Leptolyngbya sp. PLA2]|nr:replicative DNA helicase [Leptolyngbya sp.]MCE7971373.1 replicative DNA helicase [Leptolyngbya sp. PL-A2]MCQ3940589.1 replicative DNA helicase [cyanobacterium CYA1]GIK20030.1 MAG: replicative DNA helicase [Planctomycetota bacterium]
MPVNTTNGFDASPAVRRQPRPELKLDRLFDRLPPHSTEAEMSLLGSLLLEPRMIADVVSIVTTPDAFYHERHATIYRLIVELGDKHSACDVVQLVDTLRDRGQLDGIGGQDYLVELASGVPSAVNARHYARVVADKHRLRRLIEAAGHMLYDAFHAGHLGPEGVGEVLDRSEQSLFEIAHEPGMNDPQSLDAILQSEMDRLEAIESQGGLTGLPSGFADLDALLSGLHPGEMVILAARPSMGKTALALNLAEQIALGGPPHAPRSPKRAPVAIFSLEMSRSSLAQRLISARSGLDLQRLRTGDLRQSDWETLTRVCGELHDAPIYIDDTPALTVLQLRARARRMAAQFGVRAIMIDYLQLLTAPGAARESRQVEVAAISRGIKALARELDLPVVCLAQLNRSSEHREGNRPRMADLRESGSIEQDADVVLLLHREEYYHRGDEEWEQNNPDKVNLAELIVAKQRNGPTGLVKLTWDSRATRFKDHDPYHTTHDGYESVSQAGRAAASEPKPRGPAAYAPGARTGPVENFRDGGGPEAFDDDTMTDDEPPF